jgi:hypothetical protein
VADHWATWAVQILAQMEQKNLMDQWDLTDQYYNQPQAVREAQVKAYYCPSRRPANGISSTGDKPDNNNPSSNHYPGALSDYAGNSGDFAWQGSDWLDGKIATGAIVTGEWVTSAGKVISWKSRVRLADVTDGTSSTFLIGEKHVTQDKFTIAVGDGSIYNGDHEWNFCRVAGPNYPLARNPKDATSWNLRFGSYHPAVCQFVLVDGSVKPIRVNLDTTTLSRLSVRNDGQPVLDY